ncbi:pyridoxal phosphate-dependent transferase [Dactylonectria macrodidyma]|uniref:Pyridoxal phosphate-dependent transferase n=1 Tax=Dactylonectria macrodidyma TaxID=307937 RepID=A0A9P9DY38_9HYPO|nr:pyridoxal phosphate-dependent transferase [Dactylonectria macrodidyma]
MAHPFVSDSHLLHRTFAHRPERVVSASGVSLYLDSGRQVLDASAGPAVSCLGYGRPEVADAIANQVNQLAYLYSGARFTCDATEELATALLQGQPGGLCKAIFVNSGSEATDAAIKLATQYWHERGMPLKSHFIARKQSYHGNTIGALCISGHDSRRAMYRDWLSGNVSFVDPCFAYRLKGEDESDDAYVKRLAVQLEAEILRVGPEKVSAFVAETVSGTTLGCLPAVPGYFKAAREICDKYDVLLILDEIMCGMGKTGTVHAWQQEGITGPDIQTIGKALGGGFIPLSGVLLSRKIFDALADGSGGLAHGHTFQAHPVACAAALEVQRIIRDENILGNVTRMGHVLETLLKEQIGPLEFVGDIRGRGLFWAVEFMQNPVDKVPFAPNAKLCNQIVDRALELGLNVLGNLGTTGEVHVEHVIMSPPYVVTEAELTQMPNSGASRREGYTRQRRGCLTCRQRKKKCDQIYPVCSHCSRLNLVCKREAPRAVQSSLPADPSKSIAAKPKTAQSGEWAQGVMMFLGRVPPPYSGPSEGTDSCQLAASRRAMLRYYTVTLAFLLTTNLENNCFLSVILPMAFECPTLTYAVSAWASSHLALRDNAFKSLALQHRGHTIARFQESMQQGDLSTEMCLAVTMVLCSMECISEATDCWYPHLAGAAAALTKRPGSLHDPKHAIQSTFEGRWLLRNFAYHDVMTSVSLDCRPLIRGFYWASEDDSLADPYFGFASRLLFLISETSVLNSDFAEAKDERNTGNGSNSHLTSEMESFGSSMFQGSFSERAHAIEEELQNWTSPPGEGNPPLALLGESYRNAALIHLYRTLRRHIDGYSAILQAKIDFCVEAICNLSRDVPEGCLVECTLLFPLFMAGGEAQGTEQIEMIREKLQAMERWRKFRNVQACLDVLDEVWRRKTDGSRRSDWDHVDWLDVVKQRGWKLSIS